MARYRASAGQTHGSAVEVVTCPLNVELIDSAMMLGVVAAADWNGCTFNPVYDLIRSP